MTMRARIISRSRSAGRGMRAWDRPGSGGVDCLFGLSALPLPLELERRCAGTEAILVVGAIVISSLKSACTVTAPSVGMPGFVAGVLGVASEGNEGLLSLCGVVDG